MSKSGIKLPERQPIAGNPYTVHEVPRLGSDDAFCDKEGKEIVIEAGAPSEWERTIRYAHECIHGGEKEYSMGPFRDEDGDSDVDRLAHLFAEIHYSIVLAQEDEE
jgi:hypothetical protein